jgi:hypothetical protein
MNFQAYQTGTGYLQTTIISLVANLARYHYEGSACSAPTRCLSPPPPPPPHYFITTYVSSPHQKQTRELRETAYIPTKASSYLDYEGAEFSG